MYFQASLSLYWVLHFVLMKSNFPLSSGRPETDFFLFFFNGIWVSHMPPYVRTLKKSPHISLS